MCIYLIYMWIAKFILCHAFVPFIPPSLDAQILNVHLHPPEKTKSSLFPTDFACADSTKAVVLVAAVLMMLLSLCTGLLFTFYTFRLAAMLKQIQGLGSSKVQTGRLVRAGGVAGFAFMAHALLRLLSLWSILGTEGLADGVGSSSTSALLMASFFFEAVAACCILYLYIHNLERREGPLEEATERGK